MAVEFDRLFLSYITCITCLFSSLTTDCKFGHDPGQYVDSLIERRQRYSLIISMHSFQIFFRQRKWHQPYACTLCNLNCEESVAHVD